MTGVAVGRWHLHMEGHAGYHHICDLHRALGRDKPCMAEHGDGDCDHVRFELCMCVNYPLCEACWNERDG